ncbi:Anti-sigma-K factor RskA [Hymenobacter daecheongensis DSM 21074]|uniref:Regulator of SigK n=1 Tax=Hymenobacter daecheongensis DSM 21074 TaxID=1121955 RepID=A0A1M6E9S6_9BACT|nr:anti-sigma factor [Hymenobacter daecheongensis]SHI82119.1 Anti-sigma-K factor RskA [Hymenobacter daecheongensis DSM 21074]
MNTQDYIESGILEEYALGLLSEVERAEVERRAAESPEIRQELATIAAALESYAQAHTHTPPAGMRERVLAGWQAAIHQEAPSSAAPAGPATEPVVRQLVPEAEAPAARFSWLMAASVALLLFSAAANLVLYNRWKDAETSLVIAQSEQARVATTMQAVNKSLASRTAELSVLRSDEFKSIELAGMPAAPTAKARVLYNAATKAVFVDVRNLPAPPAGKQYQLWALDQGKPVDAGMLAATTTAGDSLQQMKDIGSAQAFAMTVEPEGGSQNPTMETLTVLGKF